MAEGNSKQDTSETVSATLLANPPTLPELLNFNTSSGSTINIVEQIGTHHSTLGPLLLKDVTGAITDGINCDSRSVFETTKKILSRWLQGGGKEPVAWSTLIDVLNDAKLSELAQKIERELISSSFTPTSDSPPVIEVQSLIIKQPSQQRSALMLASTPTLTELLNFKTPSGNTIVQQIGVHYSKLGPLLLNDDDCSITKRIVHENPLDVEAMNKEILSQWVKGHGKQPVTWFTLIDVLKEVGLLELVVTIQEELIKAQVQEQEKQNTEWKLQLETCTQHLQTTEETIKALEEQIRKKEGEKEEFLQAKNQEIFEIEQKLWRRLQEEKSSKSEIEDLKRQLQSSEALVTLFQEYLQQRDLKLDTKFASSACHVTGPGLQSATVDHETHIIVELTGFSDTPCLVQQRVSAELSSITTSTNPCRTALAVQVISPSRYKVLYKPLCRGRHEIFIRLNDTDIKGSPFIVTALLHPNQLATLRIVEGMKTPYSIVFSSCNEMLVSEKLEHKVSVFDDERNKTERSLGKYGHSSENMIFPQGMAIDDYDNIYVSSSNKLQKFNSGFDLVKCVDKDFNDPYGITVYNNEVYVCDCNNHRIKVYNLELDFIRAIGSYGKETGKFCTPYDVKFNSAGYMYVADWGNERVQVLDHRGHYIRLLDEEEGGRLCRPSSLHIVDNYVYVSDYNGGCIVVYETSGTYVTSFGNFMYPYCITSCSDGYIYVCDREQGKIQIF